MIPTGLTITAMLGDAASVVTQFQDLILFVVSLGLGIWAVRFVIKQAKRAR